MCVFVKIQACLLPREEPLIICFRRTASQAEERRFTCHFGRKEGRRWWKGEGGRGGGGGGGGHTLVVGFDRDSSYLTFFTATTTTTTPFLACSELTKPQPLLVCVSDLLCRGHSHQHAVKRERERGGGERERERGEQADGGGGGRPGLAYTPHIYWSEERDKLRQTVSWWWTWTAQPQGQGLDRTGEA